MDTADDESKTFLALFLGAAPDDEKARLSAAESHDLMERWISWATKHQASIVDGGAPLGANARIDSSGVADAPNRIVTYSVIRAASRDAAAEILSENPHLGLHPGNSIEIMERMSLPGEVAP
jgi:hypothetical protein